MVVERVVVGIGIVVVEVVVGVVVVDFVVSAFLNFV